MLAAPLLEAEPSARKAEEEASSSRAASVAAHREAKRRLLHGLWCTGVFLRLLTLLNALALIGAAGYAAYAELAAVFEPAHGTVEVMARARLCIEIALPLIGGLFLFGLEWASTCSEASARASLGLAFTGSGRFLIFMGIAVISVPALSILPYGSIECLALAVAVTLLPVNAILQSWLLSCVPDFAKYTVAELNAPALTVDNSQFPQVDAPVTAQSASHGCVQP